MADYLVVLIISGVFILISLVLLAWGKREKTKYSNSLAHQHDLREFFSGWPERPEAMSLKIGGLLFLCLGVASLALSLIFWLKS